MVWGFVDLCCIDIRLNGLRVSIIILFKGNQFINNLLRANIKDICGLCLENYL